VGVGHPKVAGGCWVPALVSPRLCTWVLHVLALQAAKFGDNRLSRDPAWALNHLRGVTARAGSLIALLPVAVFGGYPSVFFAEPSCRSCMGRQRPVHAGGPVVPRDHIDGHLTLHLRSFSADTSPFTPANSSESGRRRFVALQMKCRPR
jgi:hypothetical protein